MILIMIRITTTTILVKPQSNYNASSSVRHLDAVPKQELHNLERGRGTHTPATREGFDRTQEALQTPATQEGFERT